MNPLESRKQLLIAESELNRAQLVQEWQTMAGGVRSFADRAATIRFLGLAAASAIAGLASFLPPRPAPVDGKRSWWQTLLNGVRLAASFWSEFHSRPKS